MPKFKDPNPEWPVPVFKVVEGELLVKYAHNTKEYDNLVTPEEDHGLGYSATMPCLQEFPKLMSHPEHADVKVHNAGEQAKREAQGFSFDHWANKVEKESKVAIAQAEAKTETYIDPKAQHRIDKLEGELDLLKELNRKQSAQIDQLLGALDSTAKRSKRSE
jgi:hypothetical protein